PLNCLLSASVTSCDSFFYSLAEPSTATLNIHPNKLQFFKYETIILTCHVPEDSTGWRVMRNTSIRVLQPCSEIWKSQHLSCSTEDTFPSDTGAYWCQSDRGEPFCFPDKGVILQSPSLPVMEGDPVTFLCLYKEKDQDTPTSNFQTSYFRNGAFIGRHSKGNMTLPSVSMSDEGLYKCEHPTKGQSAESKLTVSRRGLCHLNNYQSMITKGPVFYIRFSLSTQLFYTQKSKIWNKKDFNDKE
uniref:Ig-like domain-containing protein n=1 Tax=Echeneis naucrates TaxID=173247 RepID=A0A665T3B8_ECHNA